MTVKIFSDGSAKGNPGPGGFGTILQYTDKNGNLHEKEISRGYSMTTNNRMELLGAIEGLEALKSPCEVELVSDSKYLTDAFNKNWIWAWKKNGWKKSDKSPVKNRDLWERLLNSMKPHKVSFVWVHGHMGHPENERCDKLATTSASGSELEEDVTYGKDNDCK